MYFKRSQGCEGTARATMGHILFNTHTGSTLPLIIECFSPNHCCSCQPARQSTLGLMGAHNALHSGNWKMVERTPTWYRCPRGSFCRVGARSFPKADGLHVYKVAYAPTAVYLLSKRPRVILCGCKFHVTRPRYQKKPKRYQALAFAPLQDVFQETLHIAVRMPVACHSNKSLIREAGKSCVNRQQLRRMSAFYPPALSTVFRA